MHASLTTTNRTSLRQLFARPQWFVWLIGVVVLCVSYAAAHWSRLEHMALFWPVNAVATGLLVRHESKVRIYTWLAIACSLLLADYLTQTPLPRSLMMTAANLTQIITAFYLFKLLPHKVKYLQTADAVIYLFFICFISCCAAALVVTLGFTVINEWQYLALTPNQVLGQWLVTSLVDMTLILPVLLAWPKFRSNGRTSNRRQTNSIWADGVEQSDSRIAQEIRHALPVICLIVLMLLSIYMGGYGAMMLPIPAVLWCALSYKLFTTILISFLVCLWQMYANAVDLYQLDFSIAQVSEAISLRLGITMLALCPIMVACIHRSNLEINAKLTRALDHDTLTQCLSRSAFFRYGNKILNKKANQPLALMMLDLDHFKRVNDQYGHGIGDLALKHAVEQIQSEMREQDLFARLGGEEFAIMLNPLTYQDAMRFAERLRASIEANPLVLANGKLLPLAISIGLVYYNTPPPLPLNVMLVVADEALYEAKRKGRNRVVATHIA